MIKNLEFEAKGREKSRQRFDKVCFRRANIAGFGVRKWTHLSTEGENYRGEENGFSGFWNQNISSKHILVKSDTMCSSYWQFFRREVLFRQLFQAWCQFPMNLIEAFYSLYVHSAMDSNRCLNLPIIFSSVLKGYKCHITFYYL